MVGQGKWRDGRKCVQGEGVGVGVRGREMGEPGKSEPRMGAWDQNGSLGPEWEPGIRMGAWDQNGSLRPEWEPRNGAWKERAKSLRAWQ
jgi:hypothetical protein